jgi:hypothetical protein
MKILLFSSFFGVRLPIFEIRGVKDEKDRRYHKLGVPGYLGLYNNSAERLSRRASTPYGL